jgi:SAM-dependent methyltransferase/uncharacterized protein YbaR (Trm112 family)
MDDLSSELLKDLACPVDQLPLVRSGEELVCPAGHRYPVVQGVPVLLRSDVEQTIGIATQSLQLSRDWVAGHRPDPYFIETLGISEEERDQARAELKNSTNAVDPVISNLVGATNGILYKNVIGSLDRIPIPDVRLAPGNNRKLLDVGCNWGRWSLAAAARGYHPIGVDPSLGAILAAKRLAKLRGLSFSGVVGDARYLPLRTASVDMAFSYSVLQHFSESDAHLALRKISRVVRPGGSFRIQMASAMGIRSFQHLVRRRFRTPKEFEVRYWMPGALKREFRDVFGDAQLEVDCYFGLGLQPADRDLYDAPGRLLISLSEGLRKVSRVVTPMKFAADSLYIVGSNRSPTSQPDAAQ